MKYALRKMIRTRFCPPIELLHTSRGQKHLEYCPLCKFEFFTTPPNTIDIPKGSIAEKIRAGQIWQIDPNLSGWVDWRYFNSPVVFVTSIIDEHHVQVAPIHTEFELALNADVQIGKSNLYVESWNTFPILKKYLKSFAMETDILSKVEEAKEIKPRPLTEIHELFIIYEAEVASHFTIYEL